MSDPKPMPLTAEEINHMRGYAASGPLVQSPSERRLNVFVARLCDALDAERSAREAAEDKHRESHHQQQETAFELFECRKDRARLVRENADLRAVVERLAITVRFLNGNISDRITIPAEQEAAITEAYGIVYKAADAARTEARNAKTE